MSHFKLIIDSLIILIVLVHGHHGTRNSRRESKGLSRRNRIERLAILSVFSIWVILTVLYLSSSLLDALTIHLPEWLRWAGILLLAIGDGMLVCAHYALGKNWSLNPEIRQGHTLITTGIYRRVRHPMYTAYLAIGIGFLLSSANWLVGPVFFIPIVAICWIRMAIEEKMMLEQFGEAYSVYAEGTGRLLPKIWLSNAQEQQTPAPLDIAPPRQ